MSVAPLAGAWIEIEMTVGSDGKPVSLPSRERGLKSGFIVQGMIQPESLPSRERGLKSESCNLDSRAAAVAPLAGAWIEIIDNPDFEDTAYAVAPLAGAWIEI